MTKRDIMTKKFEARGYKVWNFDRIYLNINKAYYDLDKDAYIYDKEDEEEVGELKAKLEAEENELIAEIEKSFEEFKDEKPRLAGKHTVDKLLKVRPNLEARFEQTTWELKVDNVAVGVEFTKEGLVTIR